MNLSISVSDHLNFLDESDAADFTLEPYQVSVTMFYEEAAPTTVPELRVTDLHLEAVHMKERHIRVTDFYLEVIYRPVSYWTVHEV